MAVRRTTKGVNMTAITSVAVLAPSVAALIDIDDLRDFREGAQRGLQCAVVSARTAVQSEDGRAAAHLATIWDKLFPLAAEVQARPAYLYLHAPQPTPLPSLL